MHDSGVDPQVAIENPDRLPFRGRTGDKLRSAIRTLSNAEVTAGRDRAIEQLERASECAASILVHGDPEYPRRVYESNNPVPVLYVRGDPDRARRPDLSPIVDTPPKYPLFQRPQNPRKPRFEGHLMDQKS